MGRAKASRFAKTFLSSIRLLQPNGQYSNFITYLKSAKGLVTVLLYVSEVSLIFVLIWKDRAGVSSFVWFGQNKRLNSLYRELYEKSVCCTEFFSVFFFFYLLPPFYFLSIFFQFLFPLFYPLSLFSFNFSCHFLLRLLSAFIFPRSFLSRPFQLQFFLPLSYPAPFSFKFSCLFLMPLLLASNLSSEQLPFNYLNLLPQDANIPLF
jgi:hypothetical protein